MKPLLMVTLQHFTNHFKEASTLFFDCIKKMCWFDGGFFF